MFPHSSENQHSNLRRVHLPKESAAKTAITTWNHFQVLKLSVTNKFCKSLAAKVLDHSLFRA